MTPLEWVVVAGGAAAIAWVNWYFFLAERGTVVAVSPSGEAATNRRVAEVVVAVKGGYNPASIRTRAGQPLRLVFDRRETSACSEEIVFPDFAVKRFLPAFRKTVVEITPPTPGRYEFTCGMSMLRGEIIAE